MFAVLAIGGRQYNVKESDIIYVEKIEGEEGEKIKIKDVLMLGEGESGLEYMGEKLSGIEVEAEILEQKRGKKIRVLKKRRRKNSRKLMGHRQYYTVLRINSISTGQ